jgi:hypothetical protein
LIQRGILPVIRRDSAFTAGISGQHQSCGSGLAREEAITADIHVEYLAAIVGTPPGASPLPQVIYWPEMSVCRRKTAK